MTSASTSTSVPEMFRLPGLAAVVTGAGRGIGAAVAVALAQAGADVVIAARSLEELRATAETIAATGQKSHVLVADLSDLGAAAALAGAARREFGRLDIVVNNVGGAVPRPFLETSTQELEEAFHFNVATTHALTTAAVPLMLQNDGGSVINISSVMALVSGRGFLSYGTAKAALVHYTRLAAQDLAPRIRVNAIAAGTIATAATQVITDDAELLARVESATPLRRLGTVNDVAAAVLYLASPAGAYVTGAVLEVDGGLQIPSTQQPIPDL
jgi:7-alpha-hydroxysteroid dehydrogenase